MNLNNNLRTLRKVPKLSFHNWVFFMVLFFTLGFMGGDVYGQTVSISASQPNADEDGPVDGQFTVSVTGGGIGNNYIIGLGLDGASTATSGADFNPIPAQVAITTGIFGTGFAIVDLEVLDDFFVEVTENVIVNITTVPSGTTIGTGSATVNIADDDVAGVNVTPTIGTTTEAGGTATFTFTLTSQPTASVTIPINNYDATENSGPASVVIPPAQWNTGVDLTITGLDDAIADGDITTTINTGNVTSPDPNYDALSGADVAQLTVTNEDDDTATLTIEDVSQTEGLSMQFTVTLNNAVANPFSVNVNFGGGTAQGGAPPLVAPEDYNNVQQTLNFNGTAGETRQFNVSSLNDNILEADETFIVSLTASDPLIDDSDTAIGTILNDDVGQVIVVTEPGRETTNEEDGGGGNRGRFQINLSQPNTTGSDITVTYSFGGTATASGPGQDFNDSGNGTAVFGNNDDSIDINITPINDTAVEGDETVVLNLGTVSSSAYAIGAPNSAIVTILDDDIFTATITATDATAAENTPATATGLFTIDLGSPNTTGGPIVVTYNITGTAINGTDYNNIGASVSIPNGERSRTVSITPIDDQIQEGTETVILTLTDSSPDYDLGTAGTRSATVNIADNDQATLTISNVTANENVASGVMVFNVVLDIAVAGGTTVSYTISDGTATGGGVDYTASDGNLSFTGTAGEVETITVTLVDDQLLEDSETFTVQLGLPSNGVQRANGGTAIGTINDDDNCVAAPELDTSLETTFCGVESTSGPTPIFQNTTISSLDDYTSTTPPAGRVGSTRLVWSTSNDPLNENAYLLPAEVDNPTLEGSYFGFFLDDNGTPNNFADDCASGTIEVQLTLNIIPQIIQTNNGEACGPGTVELSAEASGGASLSWYTSPTAVTPIGAGENFTTPNISSTTSFYVEAVSNGCVSERVEVVATIGNEPTTGTIVANGGACSVAAFGNTVVDLDSRLVGASAGTWTANGNTLVINADNEVDFEGVPNGPYTFTYTTNVATAPCTDISVDVVITVSDCNVDDDNDGLLTGEEFALDLDPDNPDTDGDGILDGEEVGPDVQNPLDEDGDGIIDALDSNILDSDGDGVNDQQDPANDNPCIPDNSSPDCPVDLEITKVANRENVAPGEEITFTITVRNLTDKPVDEVIIVDDLTGTGFDYVSHTTSLGEYSPLDESWTWTMVNLPALGTATLDIKAIVLEDGSYTNMAELITSTPLDDNPENDKAILSIETQVYEGIDLDIEKSVNNETPLVGEQITFTIKVTNLTNASDFAEAIENIVVRDSIEVGKESLFEYEFSSASIGVYTEETGIWTIPSLLAGEQNAVELQISGRVTAVGSFRNTAIIDRSSPRDSKDATNNQSTIEITINERTSADPGFLFNQFSPNGDGTNDVLRLNLEDGDNNLVGIQYAISIVDRYGNTVFEGADTVPNGSQSVADIWDGTFKGKEVPKGTYFYVLEYTLMDAFGPMESQTDKGWIQLIR